MNNKLTLSYVNDAYDKFPKEIVGDLDAFFSENVKTDSSDKRNDIALLPFISSTGKSMDDFTQSNILFIDIDDKVDFRITRQIFCSTDYFFRGMDEIIFIQNSFSGATHICVEIPLCNSKEEWLSYANTYYDYFCKKFEEKYGSHLNVREVMDNNMLRCNQLLFISNNKVIFNSNHTEGVKICIFSENQQVIKLSNEVISAPYQSNKVKENANFDTFFSNTQEYQGLPDTFNSNHTEGVNNNNILSAPYQSNKVKENANFDTFFSNTQEYQGLPDTLYFKNFKNEDLKIPYILNQFVPDFEYRGNISIDDLCEEIIRNLQLRNDKGKWYNKMRVGDNVLFAIRLDAFNEYYDNDNKFIRIQRGERKKTLRLWIKRFVLNAIATCNHNNDYSTIAQDLSATIFHTWYNKIEFGIGEGFFGLKELCDCVRCTFRKWNEIYVPVSYNKYWTAPEKETFNSDEKLYGWLRKLAKGKFDAVDATFKDMFYGEIQINNLKTMSQIASWLNTNDIASKTKNGWTVNSVYRIMEKLDIKLTDDFSYRLEELLSQGEKYYDIADKLNYEGYTTKQGKQFDEDSIKNYVRRKLKK